MIICTFKKTTIISYINNHFFYQDASYFLFYWYFFDLDFLVPVVVAVASEASLGVDSTSFLGGDFFFYFFIWLVFGSDAFSYLGLHDLPSQKGFFFVSLHPHRLTYFTFCYIVNLNGLNLVPAWLLSQKGCLRLWPQLHHLYILSYILGLGIVYGPIWGLHGSALYFEMLIFKSFFTSWKYFIFKSSTLRSLKGTYESYDL